MIYSLLGGDLRSQTAKRRLKPIGVGNAVAREIRRVAITAKANSQIAETATQWITKRSLFVTSDFDARWFVNSFHE